MVYVSRDLVRCLEFTARPIGMYRGWMHPDKESVALSLYCILDGHMIMGLHHTGNAIRLQSAMWLLPHSRTGTGCSGHRLFSYSQW